HYVALDGPGRRLFDGQHLALLQLQRHSLQFAPAISHYACPGLDFCVDLVLLALGPFWNCAHLHVLGCSVAAAVDYSSPAPPPPPRPLVYKAASSPSWGPG